jgi:glycosyltransferase involved in cell wall biosynthesis
MVTEDRKMNEMPKVSVILPTYNYGCFLGEAIQSVLDQTFEDFELIVVDDGSTDNTREVVHSFTDPRLRCIYKENGGESSAYNVGIHASRGEYIAFLDSDDTWLPQKLELQVKAMDSAPQAGIIYSDVYYFDSKTGAVTGTFFQRLKNPPPQGSVLEAYIEEFFAHPSTWLVKKSVFEQIGMWDETLRNCEDDDMLFRMASCFEFEAVLIPLAMVRTHPEQKSRKKQIHFTSYLRYLNKAMQSPILNSRMRASLRRAMCLCHFRYAKFLVSSGKLGKGGREFLASLKANPRVFGYFVMSHLIEKLTRRFRPSRRGGRVEAMPRWLQYLRPAQVVNKDSSAPKVSVVIPAYNSGRFLGEAIQSVLDQTFGDFELIVVDDGSTDNTRDVVRSFTDPRIEYIYQKNRGSSAAYNRGIHASGGEYIAFLDSDDIWFPQNLELKVKMLDSNPGIALVCSDTYLFDDQTGNILGRYWHDHAQFKSWFDPRKAAQNPLRYMLSRGTFIIETITMVRREVFNEVGDYDESLRSHEDWDVWCRVTQRFAIETIDMPLSMNRRHDTNLSGNSEQMYESEQMALNKALHSYSLEPDEVALVKRRLARLHFLYGSRSVVDGEIALGRKRLLTSIRIDPWHIEPYFHLVKSLLGYRLIITVRLMKEWLVRRLANADHQAIPVEEFNDGNSASGETDDKDSKKKLYESSQS